MLTITVFLLLQATSTRADERLQAIFKTKNSAALFDETPISERTSDSLISCSQHCKSANFIKSQSTCSLLDKTYRTTEQKRFVKQANTIHLEKVNSDIGSIKELAVPSCKSLSSAIHPSGIYWVDPDGGSHANAFKVYCEMETDEGGWTLVWSYTFTDYEHFWTHANAVTPRPNWPALPEVNVPVSTTPPLNETDSNAMNFSLWKQFGKEILIKSNINNWFVCSPGNGSLVEWETGNVTCKTARRVVTDTCSDEPAPSKFRGAGYCGPLFNRGVPRTHYYYFDGCTGIQVPAHDPCGQNGDNGLKNVENPHGNIFVR
ncbi:hypothetical protein ACROYT_G034076 [Oculina patagonica]